MGVRGEGASMSQSIGPVLCDGCAADITCSANSIDYRLVLRSEGKPPCRSLVTDMMVYDPLPNGPLHFCDLRCLREWVTRIAVNFKTRRSVVMEETFTDSQVIAAIREFLKYGEQEFNKSHSGYFSGDGWAARCLRFHMGKLEAKEGG